MQWQPYGCTCAVCSKTEIITSIENRGIWVTVTSFTVFIQKSPSTIVLWTRTRTYYDCRRYPLRVLDYRKKNPLKLKSHYSASVKLSKLHIATNVNNTKEQIINSCRYIVYSKKGEELTDKHLKSMIKEEAPEEILPLWSRLINKPTLLLRKRVSPSAVLFLRHLLFGGTAKQN